MQVGKIEIKIEYTSEDGYLYWVKTQKRKNSKWVSLGGSDNINVAFREAVRSIGMRK